MKLSTLPNRFEILFFLCVALTLCLSINAFAAKPAKSEHRNLDETSITQEGVTNMIQNYCSKLEDRIEYLESTSDWLVRFSSTLREDVFEEIEKYLDNIPHSSPDISPSISNLNSRIEYLESITDTMLKGFNSLKSEVEYLESTSDWLVRASKSLRQDVFLEIEKYLENLDDRHLDDNFREKVRKVVDECINGNDTSPAMDVITRDDLNTALEEERAKYEKYVEDFMTDQGFNRPTVDPYDIEEVYNQMGELEKNFREFEDTVQQKFIKLEQMSKHNNITNLVWKIAEITRKLESHDETIASMLKQLDGITEDIDELRDAGVGPECQGLDDTTDSIFGDIFKKLDEQDRKLKYLESVIQKMSNKKGKGKIKTTKEYWNMKTEELVQRLLWLLKNGSIDNDEQEICELVGELRVSGYITLGAWNLFKQTMGYYQYIEQEPHLEKSLESIYSILKEDNLFEMFDLEAKTSKGGK